MDPYSIVQSGPFESYSLNGIWRDSCSRDGLRSGYMLVHSENAGTSIDTLLAKIACMLTTPKKC
jgi:hypothetical protein